MKRLRALLPATFPGRTFFRGSLLALLGSVLLLRCDFFDILPPEISIISPTSDQSYFGTFPLEVKATDNRSVDRVEVFLDGNSVHEFSKFPYKVDIDFDQISVSSATLKAVANDQADNSADATVEVSLSLGLKITSPIGGEVWAEQSTQSVTWESSGNVGSSVKLEYSLDDGTTWQEISSSTPNDGEHPWTLPNLFDNATSSLVRLNSTSSSFADSSGSAFTILAEANFLALTSPNGGEVWAEQSTHDITWTSGGDVGDDLSIDYSIDNGSNWNQISALTPNDGSHAWTLPGLLASTSECQVRIASTTAAFGDSSDANFTIAHIIPANQIAKLTASDPQADDRFGISVAVSGNVAVVGAYLEDSGGSDAGAAYVFEQIGGAWTEVAKLTASDAQAGDRFGFSVAVSGGVALVGADGEDSGGTDAGAAYVFEKSGGAWTEVAKLTASDPQAGDWFGRSVAVSEGVAVVGADGEDSGGTDAGVAYVFESSGGVWIEVAKLTASDAQADDRFGSSVAVSGGVAVVGANLEDSGGSNAGAAYVYEHSGGAWTEVAKLTASDAEANDKFGYSVAVSGDVALVGAPTEDSGGSAAGTAYVFEQSGGSWTEAAKLTASDAQAIDWFGWSVAISGDVAVVGARLEDSGGNDAGAAYVFESSGGVWSQVAKLTASDAQLSDQFGITVAVSGDVAVVGAHGEDSGGQQAGAAYIFQ